MVTGFLLIVLPIIFFSTDPRNDFGTLHSNRFQGVKKFNHQFLFKEPEN